MLVVETIAKIRRAYFVQKKAIKEICRELSISRKVVRRVLRSGATEFVDSQIKCATGYVRDRHGTEIQPPQP
jgi:DNA-binding transcriptional regulator LsrR (DeoR family)